MLALSLDVTLKDVTHNVTLVVTPDVTPDVTSHQAKTPDSLIASPGAAVRQGVLDLLAADNMRNCDGTHDGVPTCC